MEEMTMTTVQMLTGYGALGGVCVWLMWLFTTTFRRIDESLCEISATLKLMREEEEE